MNTLSTMDSSLRPRTSDNRRYTYKTHSKYNLQITDTNSISFNDPHFIHTIIFLLMWHFHAVFVSPFFALIPPVPQLVKKVVLIGIRVSFSSPTLTFLWTVLTYQHLHFYELSKHTNTYFLWTVLTYQHLHYYELSKLTHTYITMNCPNLPTLTLLHLHI